MCTVQSAHSVHIVYIAQCTVYTLYSLQYTLYWAELTVDSFQWLVVRYLSIEQHVGGRVHQVYRVALHYTTVQWTVYSCAVHCKTVGICTVQYRTVKYNAVNV